MNTAIGEGVPVSHHYIQTQIPKRPLCQRPVVLVHGDLLLKRPGKNSSHSLLLIKYWTIPYKPQKSSNSASAMTACAFGATLMFPHTRVENVQVAEFELRWKIELYYDKP